MVIGKHLSLTQINKNLFHVLKDGEMSLKSFEALSRDILIVGGVIVDVVVLGGGVGYYLIDVTVRKHRKARLNARRNKKWFYKKKILMGGEK